MWNAWILGILLWLIIASINSIIYWSGNIDHTYSDSAAYHAAQSAIHEKIYDIQNSELDQTESFLAELAKGTQENLAYLNLDGTNQKFFDLTLSTTAKHEIDLWETYGSSILFKNIQNDDLFNKFVINYNGKDTNTNEDIVVNLVKYTNKKVTRCNFDDYDTGECNYIEREVVNTADQTMNGFLLWDYKIIFEEGDDGYKNKLILEWFQPEDYTYRIVFNTISWNNSAFNYYVLKDSTKKKVANNIIEIDAVGNSTDNYNRLKLQKNIVKSLQPINDFVIISNEQISK